jgi:hypothetical protein
MFFGLIINKNVDYKEKIKGKKEKINIAINSKQIVIKTYDTIFISIVNHPSFFEHFRATTLNMLNALNNSH